MSPARIYLAMLAAVAALLFGSVLRHHHRAAARRYAEEVVAYDGASAIVAWGGPQGHFVSRTGTDGHDQWSRRIAGEPDVHSLLVTREAVYVRFNDGGEMDGDRWLERINLDGRVEWKHLLADRDERISFEASGDPVIVGSTLIEPLWHADAREWRAFDTRTGWPLWQSDTDLGSDRFAIAGERFVALDHERLTVIDAARGSMTTTDGLGDGCVLGNELLLVRSGPDHERLLGLPQLDLEQRRVVALLPTHAGRSGATRLFGCATYGARKVLALRSLVDGHVSWRLVELASDDSVVVDKPLPVVVHALESSGIRATPAVIAGELPRFTAIGFGEALTPTSFGVVDLETGELVWKSNDAEYVRIQRSGSLWFVTTDVRAPGGVAVIVIDGTSGSVVGSAVQVIGEFEVTSVAAGMVWVRDRDHERLLALDARTLRPMGLRAHILAATVRSTFRPLTNTEHEQLGL